MLPPEFESREGVHYLTDYYAVLHVPKDATQEDIQKAFHSLIQLYHPDKYAHLAPEFKYQAELRSQVIINAKETLLDPNRRKAHDLQLENWKGPISQSGIPIISPGKFYPALDLMVYEPDTNPVLQKLLEAGAGISGHSDAIFTVIEDAYLANPNDDKLREAYIQALFKKDTHLSLEESTLRDAAGVDSTPAQISSPPYAYLDTATAAVEAERVLLPTQIRQTLLQVASGELKLLGAGQQIQNEVSVNPTQALIAYEATVISRFDELAIKILDLATKRQDIMKRRLALVTGTYPFRQELTDKLIVRFMLNQKMLRVAFHLNGTEICQTDIPDETLAELDNEEQIRMYIEKGYTFMDVTHQDGLPIKEELEATLIFHFESLLSKDQT